MFFTLKTDASSFPNMESLCGKRVAASRTTAWPRMIAAWSDERCVKVGKPAINFVGTESTPYTRLALNQGRVDAAVQGGPTLAYQNGIEGDIYMVIGTMSASTVPVDHQAIAFAKDDQEFGQSLKEAVASLMADGTYQKVIKKWNLPEDVATPRPLLNGQP
ncbi:ABC-type amino acid transport substrate-binding protein [Bradyrhizobium sp. USDA 4509]